MLLLYLYTLDLPNFDDKTVYKSRYEAAESALKIGDKYNLPDLGKAGCADVQKYLESVIKDWSQRTPEWRKWAVGRLERIWKLQHAGVDTIRESVMKRLITIATQLIEYEPFQELCAKDRGFALDFMRAQAQALEMEKRSIRLSA